MTANCEIIRDLLPLYFDGALSDASRTLIRAHLRTCPACRINYKQIKAVPHADTAVPHDVDRKYSDFARRLRSRRTTETALNAASALLTLGTIAVCLGILHRARQPKTAPKR